MSSNICRMLFMRFSWHSLGAHLSTKVKNDLSWRRRRRHRGPKGWRNKIPHGSSCSHHTHTHTNIWRGLWCVAQTPLPSPSRLLKKSINQPRRIVVWTPSCNTRNVYPRNGRGEKRYSRRCDNTVIFAFLASFEIGNFLVAMNRATAHLSHATPSLHGSRVCARREKKIHFDARISWFQLKNWRIAGAALTHLWTKFILRAFRWTVCVRAERGRLDDGNCVPRSSCRLCSHSFS